MSLAEVFAPAEAAYKAAVVANTWGHLAPEARKKYEGKMDFYYSEYGGDYGVLRSDFPNLPDSPWFYEHMQEYLETRMSSGMVECGVYRFVGTYMMCKNGKGQFSGKLRKVNF